MFCRDADQSAGVCDDLRRRDFLQGGALSLLGLGFADVLATKARAAIDPVKNDKNCILLFLVGGPSQLDTWDLKPDAPSEIRGPYRAISTNVAGVRISEIFPRMARHADKYALIRSCYHTAAPVHDTGHQMMQTGRLFQGGVDYPHIGCVVSKLNGGRGDAPAHVLLPHPIGNTGGNMPHGQSAGFLGTAYDPILLGKDPSSGARASDSKVRAAFALSQEPESVRRKYGLNQFGQSCLVARRMIETGVRFVTVNMFETVFNEITWDIHGSKPFSPISCYRDVVGPMYDMAYSALLEDLSRRGLLADTLVVSTGEFGRTPKVNAAGGRDHWPQCWTIMMAGGGVQGGQVIGASDAIAAAPRDRPTSPGEVAATIYHALGIPLDAELPDSEGRPIRLLEHGTQPIHELFT